VVTSPLKFMCFILQYEGVVSMVKSELLGGMPTDKLLSVVSKFGDSIDCLLARGGTWSTVRRCVKRGAPAPAYVDFIVGASGSPLARIVSA
jgi:hypothetical protein